MCMVETLAPEWLILPVHDDKYITISYSQYTVPIFICHKMLQQFCVKQHAYTAPDHATASISFKQSVHSNSPKAWSPFSPSLMHANLITSDGHVITSYSFINKAHGVRRQG